MKWSEQVVHVARKDLRHARWSLIGYTAAVGAIALSISTWPRAASAGFWGILLLPLIMMLAAAMVQADSPSRVDAFWATRPLSPSAVAVAKLVAITIAVILPGLVLQSWVLRAFDLHGTTVARLLWTSFGTQAALIVVAMMIASLTRDLRSFIIVLVMIFVAEQFTMFLPWKPNRALHVGAVLAFLATALPSLAFLGVLFYQYHSRNLRRGRMLGLVVAVGSAAVIPPMTHAPSIPHAQETRVASASIDRRIDPRSLTIAIDVPGKMSGERAVVSELRISARGPRIQWDTSTGFRVMVLDPPVPGVGRDVRWLRPLQHWASDGALHFSIPAGRLNPLLDANVKFVVEGVLDIETPRTVASIPLDSGATASAIGSRFIYEGMRRGSDGPELNVRMLTIDPNPPAAQDAFEREQTAYTFILVNDSKAEALELSALGAGGGSVMPPMPGVTFYSMSRNLRIDGPFPNEKNRVDEAWIRGSHLVVIGWQRRQRERIALDVDSRIIKDVPPSR